MNINQTAETKEPKAQKEFCAVKKARKDAGWTQRKLSKMLEIPLITIQKWECGQRTPAKYVERLVVAEIVRIAEIERKL